MITVYVLVTFYDENGVHEKGTICKVKESNFDPNYMKKLEAPQIDAYTKEETDNLLAAKQDDLVAGTGIDITGDEISCTVDPSEVSVTQVVSTGTKIATVTVDGTGTDIYAPAGGGASSLNDLSDVTAKSPSVGQILEYDGHYWHPQNNSLNHLDDTALSTPTNGQVLTFDSTTNKWKNANASSGGSATKFTVCSFSESRAVAFRDIQSNSDYAFAVNNTQKTCEDIKNAFENGGAIIVDANTSEAVVTGVIVSSGGGGSFVTFIATYLNGEIKLFNFSNSWGTQFKCSLSRSLSS